MSGADERTAARLLERRHEIAAHAIGALCQDPFWSDRFGADGRSQLEDDCRQHVAQLGEALRLGSAQPMVQYAGWQRGLLAARGLCTRHLEAQFTRIGDAVGALAAEEVERARALLQAARTSLAYTSGAAGCVHESGAKIAARALAHLESRSPDWPLWSAAAGRERVREDLLELLAYLADALHARRSETFVQHARWVDGYYGRQGRPAGYLDALVSALDREAEELHAEARAPVALVLARVRIANGASRRLA